MPTKYPNCYKREIGGHTYWVARLNFKADPVTGLRPKRKEFSAKTPGEADALRAAYKKQYERNPSADRQSTFRKFLADEFLPYEESRYLAGELTWGRYRDRKGRVNRYLLQSGDTILKTLLSDLTPELLEVFFDHLREQRLTGSIRNMIRQDIRLALLKARRRLSYPVDEMLSGVAVLPDDRAIKKVFQAEDLRKAILDNERPIESRAIVGFEFIINCRPSEMFALRWSDIKWERETVTIRRAVTKAPHGFIERHSTKTGRKGDREVPLGPILTKLLWDMWESRQGRPKASEYVFCDSHGLPLNKDSFRYVWKRVRADLGLPEGPTFYSIKTTGNTYALMHGVSSAAQAKKMGHTSTRMADNIYRTIPTIELEAATLVYGEPA